MGARRPAYLFSGLTKCAECGGGLTLSSHDLLTCFNARSRETCGNRRSIRRQEVEARVLNAMKDRFFEPGAFAEFCAGFTEELNRVRQEQRVQLARAPREIASIERRQNELTKLLIEGNEDWKTELVELDRRKSALRAAIEQGGEAPPAPAMHPHMAEVFRQKTLALTAALEHDEERDRARYALRGFLEEIVIPAQNGPLEVPGNLGEMLTAASGRNGSVVAAVAQGGCGGRI